MNDNDTPDDVKLATIAGGRFLADAPLWYYVLAEANAQWRRDIGTKTGDAANAVPVTLGPVGARIVAETILGLVVAGPNSYLSQQPSWMPTLPVAKETFTIADLITYALEL
jgi:hypothetical protein